MKITRRSWSWIHCQWKRISFHLIRHDDSMSHLSFMRLMRNVFVIIVVVFSYSPNERKMSHSVSYSRSINKHQQKKVIRPSIVAYRSKRIFSSLISTNVLRMITFFSSFPFRSSFSMENIWEFDVSSTTFSFSHQLPMQFLRKKTRRRREKEKKLSTLFVVVLVVRISWLVDQCALLGSFSLASFDQIDKIRRLEMFFFLLFARTIMLIDVIRFTLKSNLMKNMKTTDIVGRILHFHLVSVHLSSDDQVVFFVVSFAFSFSLFLSFYSFCDHVLAMHSSD